MAETFIKKVSIDGISIDTPIIVENTIVAASMLPVTSGAVAAALANTTTAGHTHEIGKVIGLTEQIADFAAEDTALGNRLTTVEEALPGKADTDHAHPISDVTNLQGSLNGLSSRINSVESGLVTHGHAMSDIEELESTLNGKAAATHGHGLDAISGLSDLLNGKAPVSHKHPISDVTNLQANLDEKADEDHTHTTAHITDWADQIAPLNAEDAALGSRLTAVEGELPDKADKDHEHDWGEITSGKPTTLAGYGITNAYQKSEVYTIEEVDAKISSVYRYKGSVANYAALPATGQKEGDVYNVSDTGDNYAWVAAQGSDPGHWDNLAGIVNLAGYSQDGHKHDGSDITTGTVPFDRLPTGTAASTVAIGNHVHDNVDTNKAGFMSVSDKVKLNGIADNANNYTLPEATTSTLGGVKIGAGLEVNAGVVSIETNPGTERHYESGNYYVRSTIELSSATPGGARGNGAVDLQSSRSDNAHIASGAYSIIAGADNTASGLGAVAFGGSNTASGDYAVALGAGNTAPDYAVVFGKDTRGVDKGACAGRINPNDSSSGGFGGFLSVSMNANQTTEVLTVNEGESVLINYQALLANGDAYVGIFKLFDGVIGGDPAVSVFSVANGASNSKVISFKNNNQKGQLTIFYTKFIA